MIVVIDILNVYVTRKLYEDLGGRCYGLTFCFALIALRTVLRNNSREEFTMVNEKNTNLVGHVGFVSFNFVLL